MPPLGGPLGGHLGADVSPLVDGQLPAAEAERRWLHVQSCRTCREAVDQELWVKNRLHAAPAPEPPRLPDPLLTAALAQLADTPAPAPRPGHRRGARRAGVAALSVGTVSAALTGVVLLTGEPVAPRPERTVVDGQPSPLQPSPLQPAWLRHGAGATAHPPAP